MSEQPEQLVLAPAIRCEFCGPLDWTERKLGRITHKCDCPYRGEAWCQAHPNGNCALPKTKANPKWPLQALPGDAWEDIFA
jgi:hypothetical protein